MATRLEWRHDHIAVSQISDNRLFDEVGFRAVLTLAKLIETTLDVIG
jgi:hypothetical protein